MRHRPHGLTLACLLALLTLASCGARQAESGVYPYPAPTPAAELPTSYPPPGAQPTPATELAEPTVFVTYVRNVYGVVIDAQLQVVHVEPGGGADEGGLRVGDRLQAIAGVALLPGDRATLQLAREAAGAAQPPPPAAGVPVPFVVEREGTTLTLLIAPAPIAARETPGEPVPTVTPVLPPFDYF